MKALIDAKGDSNNVGTTHVWVVMVREERLTLRHTKVPGSFCCGASHVHFTSDVGRLFIPPLSLLGSDSFRFASIAGSYRCKLYAISSAIWFVVFDLIVIVSTRPLSYDPN